MILLATPREGIKSGFGQQVMFKMFGALSAVIPLWCHGISSSADSDSDDSSKYKRRCKKKKRKKSAFEEKTNRVEELVTKLRQKHGSRYNTIQYRIWAEVTDVGSHE